MRVAIIVSAFPPNKLGGTEIATYNIAMHLARNGHEVHVITTDERMSSICPEWGFYVHRIFHRNIRFVGVVSFWCEIFLRLQRIDPDIVHVQSFSIGIPAVISRKILRKPYVVWGRGSDIYTPWMFKDQISRLVIKNADAVIALTDDMKEKMVKIYNKHVYVIPNGIDFSKFNNLSREDAKKRLKIKKYETIITFVGTLRDIKGVEYLVKAIKIIICKNKNIMLMLIGDGNEKEKLKTLIEKLNLEKHISFVGKVKNEEIPLYMAISDVFVLPSLSEGFPNVVLEAMASGLPIIASSVGGVPGIITDGENGFLVEPRNPEQIAKNVFLLLKDSLLRNKISQNNKEKAKDYSWENVVLQLEEVYRNCINV